MEKSNVPYDTISRQSVSSESTFSKCCFCIPIRIGCFILGYFNLVSNIFQTLSIGALTAIVGIGTHGFDHIDEDERVKLTAQDIQLNEEVEHTMLAGIGFILVMIFVANLFWLILNIACLVGLHKKRPGPIRVYVGFSTLRIILSLAVFFYLISKVGMDGVEFLSCSLDLGLTSYFTLVYYIYACKLDKERQQGLFRSTPVFNIHAYPGTIDEKHLVVA